jgi:twitching motility protein PilT
MERIKFKPFNNDELKAMLNEIAPENKIKIFEETGDIDFAYEIPNLARYRANFFQLISRLKLGLRCLKL